MDEAVRRAMARWPGVPELHGWLALTGRGEWRIAGAAVRHAGLVRFIGRNYAADARGAWYFQNGPQRVYVTLASTPMVYRLRADDPQRLESHTGVALTGIRAAWLDDAGGLVLDAPPGPGCIDDRDLAAVCHWIVDAAGRSLADGADPQASPLWLTAAGRRVALGRIAATEVESRLGFRRDPAAAWGLAGGGAAPPGARLMGAPPA